MHRAYKDKPQEEPQEEQVKGEPPVFTAAQARDATPSPVSGALVSVKEVEGAERDAFAGARHLWKHLLAAQFSFPPKGDVAIAWKQVAVTKAAICNLTEADAETIAGAAKKALTRQDGKSEFPGVGDVVREIDGHIAHALARRQRVAAWDAEAARMAALERDKLAVVSIEKLYPEPEWIDGPFGEKTRAAFAENKLALSAALVASGLTLRKLGDRYHGGGIGSRPSEDLLPFEWRMTTAKPKNVMQDALERLMAGIEGGR